MTFPEDTFVTRAEVAAQVILEGLGGLPPEPDILMATRQLREALRTLQDNPAALTWSQRGLLDTAIGRYEEAQRLLAQAPASLRA